MKFEPDRQIVEDMKAMRIQLRKGTTFVHKPLRLSAIETSLLV